MASPSGSSSGAPRRVILGGTLPFYYTQQQQRPSQYDFQSAAAAAEPTAYFGGAGDAGTAAFAEEAGIAVGDAAPLAAFYPLHHDDQLPMPMLHLADQPLVCGRKLGQGTYAEVMEVAPRFGQGEWPCAAVAKVFKDPRTIGKEVEAYTRLAGSPAAARCLGQQGNMLVLERLPMDVLTWLDRQRPPLAAIKCVMRRILEAVQRLHDRDVFHQDIKGDNIMLTSELRADGTTDHLVVRFIDFGLSEVLDPRYDCFDLRVTGTPCCMPPEKLQSVVDGDSWVSVNRRDLVNADMWAIGVLAHVLFFRQYPFGLSGDHREVLNLIYRGDWQESHRFQSPQEAEVLCFVKGLLNPDCAQRWTPAQALRQRFLQCQ